MIVIRGLGSLVIGSWDRKDLALLGLRLRLRLRLRLQHRGGLGWTTFAGEALAGGTRVGPASAAQEGLSLDFLRIGASLPTAGGTLPGTSWQAATLGA